MNDFQEQAKNWLRNVVKQNPDKIKAGVEKAGDLIDKQTGGKYADKVDSVQQKVGSFVDKQNGDDSTAPASDTTTAATEAAATTEEAASDPAGSSASTTSDPAVGATIEGESADPRTTQAQPGQTGGQL